MFFEILLGHMYTVCKVKTVCYSVFQRSFSHKYIHIPSLCPFLLAVKDIVVLHVLNLSFEVDKYLSENVYSLKLKWIRVLSESFKHSLSIKFHYSCNINYISDTFTVFIIQTRI